MFLKPGIADFQPLFLKGFFSVSIAIMAVTTSRTRNSRLAPSKYLTVFSEKKIIILHVSPWETNLSHLPCQSSFKFDFLAPLQCLFRATFCHFSFQVDPFP